MPGRFPLILVLATVFILVIIVLSFDPSQSERLSEMRRAVAFQGEVREAAIFLVFIAIAAFTVYLLVTRR